MEAKQSTLLLFSFACYLPPMENKIIRATCDTKLKIPFAELHGIQGNLREMSKENFVKLRKGILEDGMNFASHVWKQLEPTENGETLVRWWIIDGHGRKLIVKHLVEEEGYECEDVPCVEIEALSFDDAKRRVLSAISGYQTTTKQGLYEFITDLGLPVDSLERYQIPDIDLPEFKMEFFGDVNAESELEKDEKTKVEFDAYKNAAIKQVVLYYASDDYQKVLPALDNLMTEWSLEDYSQVVWRLLSEKNIT